ncbi:4Fe-4S dicluster domain-containing protein [Pelagibius sp.]|uniref:4Fe-4S dicluster domain-containing protein n=1 Tax=Pelagibius sp. TaxID=1931238 RepID=UPI002619A023|nr:4Fe-4S dicluster domain-containing protein [Pelagibius sp.]
MDRAAAEPVDRSIVIPAESLDTLIGALRDGGYQVWGAQERDGALGLAPLAAAADLPRGRVEAAEAGTVRLTDGPRPAYFDHTLPMQGLKRMVYPARERLYAAGQAMSLEEDPVEAPPIAVLGVRPCDLAALDTLTAVFESGPFVDDRFRQRRAALFLVAVNCMRPAATCFCASMNTGPRAEGGFDLVLDEVMEGDRHVFVVASGSARGRAVLDALAGEEAGQADREAARAGSQACAEAQRRHMPDGVAALLKQSYDDPHWANVAERCLSCANCTLVCPTCFCSTVEDRSSLDGAEAERWRRWDSCFGLDFSYLHGGAVRTETASRYRQWMTHKLSHWHDQFGMSGCVGCGRCIGWCPVGIDITAEAQALAASEQAA